jgi:hypothetical protein
MLRFPLPIHPLPLLVAGALAIFAPVAIGAQPPAAEPTLGLLTPFETKRHQQFVEAAASGGIELLFLGDSAVEFWLAGEYGRAEWEKHFAPLQAANFGVQGADTQSLLWRLQNGELDGYNAKVVVVNGLFAADNTVGTDVPRVIAGNTAIIAEIRKRQPGAQVLLTVAPRALPNTAIEPALRAHFAELAESDEAIHYVDVRPWFRGIARSSDRSAAYAAWAQALSATLPELMIEG